VFLNWPRGSWQYDLICGAIIAGLFVFPSPPQVEVAPLGLDDVLRAIETADEGLTSFEANMVTTDHFALFGDTEVETGTLAYLKPGFLRRELVEPALHTLIVSEGMAKIYIPRINQAQYYPIDTSEEGQKLVVPGMASAPELRAAYDVTLAEVQPDDGAGRVYVVELVPLPDTEAAKLWTSITLSVREAQWHPAERIVTVQHNGDTTTIELTEVVRNPDLKPSDFDLELPDGVEIIRHSTAAN
jgi:outer membrane lipoprotein-sorting protein